MKKTTGKVVSLVLALALVVTSFSATFAFAATKTESGTASIKDSAATVYLSNGGTSAAGTDVVLLNNWLTAGTFGLTTYDHTDVDALEISQVAHSSGDSLVKITNVGTTDVPSYKLTLKSPSTAKGTEVLSILLTGTIPRDDDTNNVRGTTTLTVKVLDDSTVVVAQADTQTPGVYPSAIGNMNKADYDNEAISADVSAYTVSAVGSALATFTAVKINNTKTVASGSVYGIEATASKLTTISTAATSLTYTLTAGTSVGTNLRFTAYDADGTSVGVANFKVANTVSGTFETIGKGDGVSHPVIGTSYGTPVSTVLSKSKTYAFDGTNYTDVTGVNVVTTVPVIMADGKIANLTGTTVTINGGTVGDVVATGNVTVADGTVSSIADDNDPDSITVAITGGTVGTVKSAATANVTGGKVGDVTAATVTAIPAADDTPVTVGKISSGDVTVDGSNSKVVTGDITVTANGAITLSGDMTTVGAINMDNYTSSLDLVGFVGTVAAPTKSTVSAITSSNAVDDTVTNATVTGAVSVDSITITDGTVKFDGAVKVAALDGAGAIVINAGKLSITDSVSGSVTLKLADAATVKAGTVVFTAASDVAAVDSFVPYGFTLKVASGTSTDTFVIDTVAFAGVVINKSSSSIVLNGSETFTASAYPAVTALPAGATIKWAFDGADDYFTTVENGNAITIKAINYDSTFASLNKGTLTASVVDEYGYDLTDYGTYDCAVNIIAKPAYTSDTTTSFSVGTGASYTFKITSDTAPVFTTGTAGVFTVAPVTVTGNNYFYKITATGKVGAATGIYVNGTKLLVASVKANFTSDTNKDLTVKGAYTVKITSATAPTFGVGTAGVVNAAFVSKTGNDYFYKLTSVGKVGTKAGVYVNGSKLFVATVG